MRGAPLPALPALPPPDAAPRGVFVSLYRASALRGCLGCLEADEPLPARVRAMAVDAATRDPRFPPIAVEELQGLAVELSILSALAATRADAVVAGTHGVVVRRGGRQGVLLPQVADQYRWDAETLVAMTCRKAGLAPGAWREPGTELLSFTAQVIRAGA